MFTDLIGRSVSVLAFAALSCGAAPALAGCTVNGCNGLVERVYSRADGSTYLLISGDRSIVDCAPYAGVYFVLPGTGSGEKNIVAMALLAQASGRELNVRIVNGSSNCTIAYATLEPN